MKLWHSTTYRLENTLDYRMERVWSLGYVKGSNWWDYEQGTQEGAAGGEGLVQGARQRPRGVSVNARDVRGNAVGAVGGRSNSSRYWRQDSNA